jgi:L-ascorbate metabolism protein UlaG (beta-lactamase superfamily)
MTKFGEMVGELLPAPTPAELEAERVIDARGSSDPTVGTEGTIAYLFTFTGGLRLVFLDSAGPITEAEQRLMRRIKQTDVAIIAYQGQYLAGPQMAVTLPLIKLFRPRLYIPTHHDALAGYFPDLGVEPLFMAIRDQLPGTTTISPLYRTPICLNVNGNRGPLLWSGLPQR